MSEDSGRRTEDGLKAEDQKVTPVKYATLVLRSQLNRK